MIGSHNAPAMSLGVLFSLSTLAAWTQPPVPSADSPHLHGAEASGASGVVSVNPTDADALLRVAVPRTLSNRRRSMAYTYAIDYRNRNFSARGNLLADYSAKYQVIFVAGLPYRRQTEENRKPLTGSEAAKEAQRYELAFAERSRMSLDQKRDYLRRPWNVDVPLPQLTSLFASRVVAEEAIEGRPAIVVESRPRPDARPTDEEERRALHKQVKLWIDREDLVVSRLEATLVAEDASMDPGTVARIDFMRKDGVWLPLQTDVRFQTTTGSETVRGETTERNADFQSFHVDVRLLDPAATGGTPQAQ